MSREEQVPHRGVELVVVGSGDQPTTCPLGLGIRSRGWECKGALSLKGLASFQGLPCVDYRWKNHRKACCQESCVKR